LRRSALVALLASLVAAAGASAGGGNNEQYKINARDRSAARAAVLQKADLWAGTWQGGWKTPDRSPAPTCANFNPKLSDLVVTGDAETDFTQGGGAVDVDTQTSVLQTAHMVQLDWQREVVAPGGLACAQQALAKMLGAKAHVVSANDLAFAHVAQYTHAYRIVFSITASGQSVRIFYDAILIGRGRTEIVLSIGGPDGLQQTIGAQELHLARLLVARIRA